MQLQLLGTICRLRGFLTRKPQARSLTKVAASNIPVYKRHPVAHNHHQGPLNHSQADGANGRGLQLLPTTKGARRNLDTYVPSLLLGPAVYVQVQCVHMQVTKGKPRLHGANQWLFSHPLYHALLCFAATSHAVHDLAHRLIVGHTGRHQVVVGVASSLGDRASRHGR